MSRAGSSADDEKPDDEKIHVCKRIRSSAFETSQTPLLNDVPRPVRCAVCKKELGAKGEGEEIIEALMISHLHRAGFKTRLHNQAAAGRTSFYIAEPKYYHIVCREHGELHQQQKKCGRKRSTPNMDIKTQWGGRGIPEFGNSSAPALIHQCGDVCGHKKNTCLCSRILCTLTHMPFVFFDMVSHHLCSLKHMHCMMCTHVFCCSATRWTFNYFPCCLLCSAIALYMHAAGQFQQPVVRVVL